MSRRPRVFRIAKRAGLSLLAICVLIPILIQVQQWTFRYRAQRLRDDFRTIRLHKSTWQDAQALMHRWGAWGHYDGVCTAANCKYEIVVGDVSPGFYAYRESNHIPDFMYNPYVSHAYQWIGGRSGALQVGFIVQDGFILRARSVLDMGIPPTHIFPQEDEGNGGLVLVAKSRQSLRESLTNVPGILGGNEQLAEHPTYKVGRTGGSTCCLMGEVTYSLDTSQADIDRFSDYNFDCFTTKRCNILEDLLPAAKDWHLYAPPWGLADNETKASEGPPNPCRTPLWAIGRDAAVVIVIDILSIELQHKQLFGQDTSEEVAKARLVAALKGSPPWSNGTELHVWPFSGDTSYPPFEQAEHLQPGKRFLAVLYEDFPRFDGSPPPEGPGFRLDPCGVLDDTPENRIQRARGFAMNDHLRVPEF